MGSLIEDRFERLRRLAEQIQNTRRHIEFGRTIIEHYKNLLEQYRADGRDTATVEHFIETFENSQKVFEWGLADLERRRDSAT